MDSELAQVRRFNRTVTQRVGALNDRYLSHDRPLGEARMLWEIGPDGCEVKALRARLDLDSGHASRLLRALEADGMVTVAPSAADGRVRTVRLTAAGEAERASLDERSDELARSFLDPLSPGQRERLVGAMHDVERLLTAALVEIAPADAAHPDARFCLRSYFAELDRRGEHGFDPAQAISAEPHELRPPAGVLLLARLRGEPIGCGAVKLHGAGPTELKRMWIAPAARGLGLGRRLLAALEGWATEHGARVLHMETNHVLHEAISLYRSAGYGEVPAFNAEPFADVWLEKRI
jgi:DNA-binding MarR family transcriptional regulator/GNAT superfamily N-acetyltransferase